MRRSTVLSLPPLLVFPGNRLSMERFLSNHAHHNQLHDLPSYAVSSVKKLLVKKLKSPSGGLKLRPVQLCIL
jgi:hypothetical protein